jgi:uncharacterized LabA/DUF88 family protein
MRVGCYIDGFNLYHAVDALRDNTLKWTNLRTLAESYLREGELLERVVFFTALNTWDMAKRGRHVNFVKAQQSQGVEVVLSRFDKVQKHCFRHDRFCPLREEKQTDVALAIEALSDCYKLGLDRILLITADSDQVPMVKAIRSQFPNKTVYMIAPPKRLSAARELSQACNGFTELTAGRMRMHSLPETIREGGKLVAARPALYGDRHAP